MPKVAVVELTAASARVIWSPTFEDVARVPTLARFADPPSRAGPSYRRVAPNAPRLGPKLPMRWSAD